VQNVSDENGRKAVNLALLARPATGLQTGVSLYLDRLAPQSLPRVSESILAVHLVYQRRVAEVLGEAIFIRHRPRGGPQFRTSAFYLQGSRRFGKWQPYFRYQYLDVPAEDPVFAPAGRSQGPAVGLRYDLGVFTALKAQYERLSGRASGAVNELRLQAAFTF